MDETPTVYDEISKLVDALEKRCGNLILLHSIPFEPLISDRTANAEFQWRDAGAICWHLCVLANAVGWNLDLGPLRQLDWDVRAVGTPALQRKPPALHDESVIRLAHEIRGVLASMRLLLQLPDATDQAGEGQVSRPRRGAPVQYPERNAEILHLADLGKSDPQIADVLSKKYKGLTTNIVHSVLWRAGRRGRKRKRNQ